MGAFFIPSIGQAPKWISFLDNLTEELEQKQSTATSEDFKFVTSNDLEQLNASHLIGTNQLKAYMHGFFMPIKLYSKLVAISDPFAFEKYRVAWV